MIWIKLSYEKSVRESFEKNNNKIIADLKNLNNEKNQSINLAHLSRQIFSLSTWYLLTVI